MGVVFFLGVIILIVFLLCVILGVPAGIVGLILFNKARKKGKKFGKPLMIISAIVLTVCVVILALLAIFAVEVYLNWHDAEDYWEDDYGYWEDDYWDDYDYPGNLTVTENILAEKLMV